ncbi:hypothetical protein ACIGXI_37105 [Kitasatospora aureofaciens]
MLRAARATALLVPWRTRLGFPTCDLHQAVERLATTAAPHT